MYYSTINLNTRIYVFPKKGFLSQIKIAVKNIIKMENVQQRLKGPISGPAIVCSFIINGGLAFMFFYFMYKIENDIEGN